MQVEVIRVIKYVGEEKDVRAALALSLPEGIKACTRYEIHVATHSSNLPPLIELSSEEVQACFTENYVEELSEAIEKEGKTHPLHCLLVRLPTVGGQE